MIHLKKYLNKQLIFLQDLNIRGLISWTRRFTSIIIKRRDRETMASGKSRMWICTHNNMDVSMAEDYLRKWSERAIFVTGQMELGENKTPHL